MVLHTPEARTVCLNVGMTPGSAIRKQEGGAPEIISHKIVRLALSLPDHLKTHHVLKMDGGASINNEVSFCRLQLTGLGVDWTQHSLMNSIARLKTTASLRLSGMSSAYPAGVSG